jgi:Replication protein
LSAIPPALYFNSLEWQVSPRDCAELEAVSRAEHIPGVHHDAERWGTFDFRNEVSWELIGRGLVNKGIHYRDCHRKGMVAECQGAEKHRFAMPYCCDLRFCSFCAPRAYARLLKKHSAVLESVRKNPRSGYRLRLITLTSLNTGSLSKPAVDLFNRSTKKTLQSLMKGQKGWGALSVDEVGFNNLNLHAHILFYGPYIKQDDLKRMWEKVSGFQVVWIEEAEVDGHQALSYMLKYVSKPPSNDPAILAQLETAFHGARRVFAWGLFYNFKAQNEVEDSADRSCPRCGAELSITRFLRPMSALRAEGLPLLNAVRREKGKDKWIN